MAAPATRLRSTWLSARVGRWLGLCVLIAFLTGLISHWGQDPDPWVPFPTRPVWGYRFTQGLHYAAGIAAVPLLLLKLWSVYPRLFLGLSGPGTFSVEQLNTAVGSALKRRG